MAYATFLPQFRTETATISLAMLHKAIPLLKHTMISVLLSPESNIITYNQVICHDYSLTAKYNII
jgi:hypothetical protein